MRAPQCGAFLCRNNISLWREYLANGEGREDIPCFVLLWRIVNTDRKRHVGVTK